MAIYLDAVNLTRLSLLDLLFACGLSACFTGRGYCRRG
jgi:hypothetical protein